MIKREKLSLGKEKGVSIVKSLQGTGEAMSVWEVEMLGHTGTELCPSEPHSLNLRITEEFGLEGNFKSDPAPNPEPRAILHWIILLKAPSSPTLNTSSFIHSISLTLS